MVVNEEEKEVVEKEEEEKDLFTERSRKISASLDMNFYVNASSGEVKADINWSEDFKVSNASFYEIKDLLISTGLTPTNKCATLDGLTTLSEPTDEKYEPFYPADPNSLNPIFPLWSESMSEKEGTVENGIKRFKFQAAPVYTLNFGESPRKINQFYITGEEKWCQFPIDFKIVLTIASNSVGADFDSFNDEVEGYISTKISADDLVETYKTVEGKEVLDFVTIEVKNNLNMRNLLLLPKTYDVKQATLTLDSWSEGGTTSKMMFFSNDLSISFNSSSISSISLLEEKTSDVKELSYGITSNSCNVQVSNYNDRFIRYKDLLKKNRVLQPYIHCSKTVDGVIVKQSSPLGTFYSDSWEISATSNFISCKAYDILYSLQNIAVFYTMEQVFKVENGVTTSKYILDGAVNYPPNAVGRESIKPANNAGAVLEKIIRLINLEKRNNGIYGSEITATIDERLYDIPMNYVLLGADTAWNILQDMANFCLANVYVNREGQVSIDMDNARVESGGAKTRAARLAPSPLARDFARAPDITPYNSFSYNLPAMSRTIVNSATVPYVTLENEASNTKKFKILKKDFIQKWDAEGEIVEYGISLKFENFYYSISKIECYINSKQMENKITPKLRVSYDGLGFDIPYDANIQSIIVNVETEDSFFSIKRGKATASHFVSQSQNGVKSFECKANNLVLSESEAASLAKKIVDGYASGKTFIETDWTGSPRMKLGSVFESYSMNDPSREVYECLSGEITINGGLRMKTKARKK